MNRVDRTFAVAFAVAAFTGVVFVGALPHDGEEMVVFAAPGTQPAEPAGIVARAGGDLVAPTRLGWAVIARSRTPDFSGRLYDSGAYFVAGSAVAALCRP